MSTLQLRNTSRAPAYSYTAARTTPRSAQSAFEANSRADPPSSCIATPPPQAPPLEARDRPEKRLQSKPEPERDITTRRLSRQLLVDFGAIFQGPFKAAPQTAPRRGDQGIFPNAIPQKNNKQTKNSSLSLSGTGCVVALRIAVSLYTRCKPSSQAGAFVSKRELSNARRNIGFVRDFFP